MRPVGTYLYGRRIYETMAVWETEPAFAAESELAAGRNVGIVVSHDDGIVSRHVRFQFLAMRSRSGVRSDGVGPAAPASCFSGLSGRRIFRLPGNAQGDHSMRWLLSKRGRSIPMTDLWAVGPVSIKSVSRIFLIHLQQFPPQAKAAIPSGRPDKHNNHRRKRESTPLNHNHQSATRN